MSNHLGATKAPIKYAVQGMSRSAEIPVIMHMLVQPLGSVHSSGEIWAATGHPAAPEEIGLAVGGESSTFANHCRNSSKVVSDDPSFDTASRI